MIVSKEQLRECLNIEKNMYHVSGPKGVIKLICPFHLTENQVLGKYINYMRKAEYHFNNKNRVRYYIYRLFFTKISTKYCLHIPINTCDIGLSIAHLGPIIINPKTRIGKNVRIHVGVNIGDKDGAPIVGDNCYIGPGVKMFGSITIGNNVKIGANAVVNKSVHENNCSVAGVPAKIVKKYVE